jgi:hypothetical protein
MQFYERFLVYEGVCFSAYFHAESHECSEVYQYFENCDTQTQAALLYLVKRICEHGKIYDQTKFNIEDHENKIYAFKPHKDRFFCFFFTGKRIVITSAYRKQKQKLDRNALGKAVRIRHMYLIEGDKS